jgi:site-specific DNA-cytosine methylase
MSPATKVAMTVHTWEDRSLSVEGRLRIQGFPNEAVVGTGDAYRLFGEAVSVCLAEVITEAARLVLLS